MSLQPHIQLSKEMTGARYALLPGDPQRVDRIVNFLDNPQRLGQNREFRAARGWYQGIEILVLSTGIGGPSTAIAIEELRQIGVTTLIRIGSCGALQDNLALGDVIIAHAAVMDDGTSLRRPAADLGTGGAGAANEHPRRVRAGAQPRQFLYRS